LTFEELAAEYHTVACTAVTNEDASKHVRYPAVTAAELPDHLRGVEADVAVVFGRERVGLTNDELARLDVICSVPASAEYPSMNLGQAATVVLYELRTLTVEQTQHPEKRHERAEEADLDRLYDQFDDFLNATGHPEPKRAKANRLVRRLIGRAHPTPREVSTLQGIFRRGTELSTPPDSNETESDES
jgi:TrmH family RNA methyltransferase